MANDLINIKEDASPTKKLASQSFTRGVDTVHAEETVITDGVNNGRIVSVTAANALKTDGSAVNQPVTDAGGSLTVDALDLDIRNLTHVASQDSVRIGDGTDLALVTAAGELNVIATAQPGVDIGDVTINNAAGASAVNIQDGGNSITIDDANLDNATLVDNAAFTDGTTRLVMSGYIFDDTAGTALTENDAAAARIDSKRAQVIVLEDATTRAQKLAINAGGAAEVQGDVAQGVAVSGNPVLQGSEARTTNPTAVTDGQAVRAMADKVGRQVVRVGHVRDLMTSATTTISTTTETTILAAVASTFLDLCFITIANTSATGIRVDIRDTTGGSVIFSLYSPATQTVGFSLVRPINQTTVNTNWTAQLSSAVTDIRIFAQAEKNI